VLGCHKATVIWHIARTGGLRPPSAGAPPGTYRRPSAKTSLAP
jgi:hypothetical protein